MPMAILENKERVKYVNDQNYAQLCIILTVIVIILLGFIIYKGCYSDYVIRHVVKTTFTCFLSFVFGMDRAVAEEMKPALCLR